MLCYAEYSPQILLEWIIIADIILRKYLRHWTVMGSCIWQWHVLTILHTPYRAFDISIFRLVTPFMCIGNNFELYLFRLTPHCLFLHLSLWYARLMHALVERLNWNIIQIFDQRDKVNINLLLWGIITLIV